MRDRGGLKKSQEETNETCQRNVWNAGWDPET